MTEITGETTRRTMSAGKVAALAVVLGATAVLLPEARSWYPGWWGAWTYSWWTGAVGLILAALCAPVAARLYQLLFRPLELLRSPDDVGYIAEDGRSKAQAANEVRRRRKTGELPPVYPNGWYRVLDSHLLAKGDVKNVTILGMLQIFICHYSSILLRLRHTCATVRRGVQGSSSWNKAKGALA